MLPSATLSDVALVLASGEGFDIQMQQTLSLVSHGLDATRGYLCLFGEGGDIRPAQEWCAPGVAPLIDALPVIPRAELPSLMALLQSGDVIATEDVAVLPDDLRTILQRMGAAAAMSAPLLGPEGVFGFIGFDDGRGPRVWAHSDQENLRTIAGLVSNAWQRHLLEQRLAASESALRVAYDRVANILEGARVGTWEWHVPSGALIVNARWAEMLGNTLAELEPVSIDAWRARVHLEDIGPTEAALAAHFAGESEYYAQEFRMRHRDGHWIWVLSRGKVIARDAAGGSLRMYGIHSDISARKALEQQVRDLAIRDPLTGLYNRRYLMERLDDIVAEHQRRPRTFSVAMLDIDFFKRVNDEYGHQAGDAVLRAFARSIEDAIREYDLFARYGGEEFLLVSPSTSAAELRPLVQRLLRRVREMVVPWGGHDIRFTFSAGLADSGELPGAELTVEHLIDLADRRLYQAKQGGRDRCVGPGDGDAPSPVGERLPATGQA